MAKGEMRIKFNCMHEGHIAKNSMEKENKFPSELGTEWKESMLQFYDFSVQISVILSTIYSKIIYDNQEILTSEVSKGADISLMRLFHYFPYHRADNATDNPKKIGSSSHTDWGLLTLVLQEPEKIGLEISYKDQWHSVKEIPGTFFVNCGDYMSLLSRGFLKSPLHRVVNHGERTSFVFFFYPNHDTGLHVDIDMAAQDYSLLKNQRVGASQEKAEIETFGDYIAEKWEQVKRLQDDDQKSKEEL